MKRFARTLATSCALLFLSVPAAMQAQNRYAFSFSSGNAPVSDGNSFLTINASTLNTSNRGKYLSDGTTDGNTNFRTGQVAGRLDARSFFGFNLANFSTTTITSASLTLFNCSVAICGADGFNSTNASEIFNVFDFTGSFAALVGGTGGTAAFGDLGSGSIFGTRSISNADNGQFVTFNFNAAGVAALMAARGSQFAVGSALQTEPTNVVPEPLPSALMGFGLVIIGGVVRRRRA
ncbi:MAG: hypothetical protein ABJC26_13760 [Gemmatimonadaceae bacterium]